MALRKIPINEYGMLLYRLDCLAFDDGQRSQLENDLRESYNKYQAALHELQTALESYEITAKAIKARHPMKKSDEKYLSVNCS